MGLQNNNVPLGYVIIASAASELHGGAHFHHHQRGLHMMGHPGPHPGGYHTTYYPHPLINQQPMPAHTNMEVPSSHIRRQQESLTLHNMQVYVSHDDHISLYKLKH